MNCGYSDVAAEPRSARLREHFDDKMLYHHSWGMGIRNSYGLWQDNKALLRSACGGKLCHPDDASLIIIEAVWDAVHGEARAPSREQP